MSLYLNPARRSVAIKVKIVFMTARCASEKVIWCACQIFTMHRSSILEGRAISSRTHSNEKTSNGVDGHLIFLYLCSNGNAINIPDFMWNKPNVYQSQIEKEKIAKIFSPSIKSKATNQYEWKSTSLTLSDKIVIHIRLQWICENINLFVVIIIIAGSNFAWYCFV